jgi:hypothetical protein
MSYGINAQISVEKKIYSLSDKYASSQKEKTGVWFIESDKSLFPNEQYVIPFGVPASVILVQVENWDTLARELTEASFLYQGTYDLNRLDSLYLSLSIGLVIKRCGDTIKFSDDNSVLHPKTGYYYWYCVRTSKTDKSMGSLIFLQNTSDFLTVVDQDGNKVEVNGQFPHKYRTYWIGGRTTWVDTTVKVVNVEEQINVMDFSLYPNPISELAELKFTTLVAGHVTIFITDILGNKVSDVLINKFLSEGEQKIAFDTKDLQAGIYFCNLRYAGNVQTVKIIVVK